MIVAAPARASVFLWVKNLILEVIRVLDYSLSASKVAVIVDTIVTSLIVSVRDIV